MISRNPVPPSQLNDEIPDLLSAACLKAMAKDPGDRHSSASELANEVENWQETRRQEAEEARRISQALYQSLVDTLPLCIWRKDLKNRFTFANDRLCAELGCRPEDVTGKTDFDFYPADLAEKYSRDDTTVLETGTTFEATEQHVEPNGETDYVHVVKTPVLDARGGLIGTQGIYWDVSELKRAERAVQDSEALHRSLIDVLPLILVRKDLEGRFTFANSRACQSFGKPLEEIAGKTDFDFFPAEVAEASQESDRQILETGRTFEHPPLVFPDMGEDRFFQSIKSPIRDSRGTILGVQIVMWDVTDRKRLEEALAIERDLLHALMGNVPDYIYFKDGSSRFIRINQALADYLGIKKPEDAVGKSDADFFTREHADPARADELEVMRTGQPIVAKEENDTWPDGHVTRVSTTKVPFRNEDGEIMGTLGISRQIPADDSE